MELQKKSYGFIFLVIQLIASTPCYGNINDCIPECLPFCKPECIIQNSCPPECEPLCEPGCIINNGPKPVFIVPRFIGGDGIVFYFHGKSGQHFALLTDENLQINSRFIGHRHEGRTRDLTWIQALGFLFGSESFSLEAAKAATWDPETDFLRFSYAGEELGRILSVWESPTGSVRVERRSDKNSITVTIQSLVEVSVKVVPLTKEDDRIHNYRVLSDNCFARLEVQFKFFEMSPEVEGVLGRTYKPDFKNQAKPGVAMPVIGGEDMYRTTSLLEADCERCKVFSKDQRVRVQPDVVVMDYGPPKLHQRHR